ncbi:MAG: phosphoribosyl transferase, partial [Rhodocyclaceae bacterium]
SASVVQRGAATKGVDAAWAGTAAVIAADSLECGEARILVEGAGLVNCSECSHEHGKRCESRGKQVCSRPDLILPVPLSQARLAQRGFNQAVEIARPLSRALGVALAITDAQNRAADRWRDDHRRHARRTGANTQGAWCGACRELRVGSRAGGLSRLERGGADQGPISFRAAGCRRTSSCPPSFRRPRRPSRNRRHRYRKW